MVYSKFLESSSLRKNSQVSQERVASEASVYHPGMSVSPPLSPLGSEPMVSSRSYNKNLKIPHADITIETKRSSDVIKNEKLRSELIKQQAHTT